MTVDSPWFKVGVSMFTDEDYQQLDLGAQWGYLTLHGLARLSGGQFGRVAATRWLGQFGHPGVDPEAVWEALEKSEMVRPLPTGKWEVAGWEKHQRALRSEDPEKKRERNARRPTTRAGRRGEIPAEPPVVDDPLVERSGARRAGPGRGPASLSLSAAAAEQQLRSKNGHQEKREGGAGGNQDRDIQDLLHDLTGARPWEKDYGKAAVDLELNYGRAEAEEAMRAVYAESVPGRRPSPWDLVRATEVRVSRDRSKRKEQEQAQARRDRAKPKERETITEEEYRAIEQAANYREPGDE